MHEKMQESGLFEIISLISTLALQGQHPIISPQVALLGETAVAADFMATESLVC